MSAPAGQRWERCWRSCAQRWNFLGRSIARLAGWTVWNPGLYGARWHARFRCRYPPLRNPLICFGLNPGPYGMAQTGIPFTDLKRLDQSLPRLAQDLRTTGEKLVLPGLAPRTLRPYLTRSFESSSVRFYRFLERGWGRAEEGWRHVVVANPCTLLFMDPAQKKNRTPADLGASLRKRGMSQSEAREILMQFDHLRGECAREAVDIFEPTGAVLFGKNATSALGAALAQVLSEKNVLSWEHPARAVPERWASGLLRTLRRRGMLLDHR